MTKRTAQKPAPEKAPAFNPKPGAAGKPQFVLVACWNCEKTDCDLYREAEKFRRTFWLCEKHSSAICPVCGTAANFSGAKAAPKPGVTCVRCDKEKLRKGPSKSKRTRLKKG